VAGQRKDDTGSAGIAHAGSRIYCTGRRRQACRTCGQDSQAGRTKAPEQKDSQGQAVTPGQATQVGRWTGTRNGQTGLVSRQETHEEQTLTGRTIEHFTSRQQTQSSTTQALHTQADRCK
jgi:hypothetical protein